MGNFSFPRVQDSINLGKQEFVDFFHYFYRKIRIVNICKSPTSISFVIMMQFCVKNFNNESSTIYKN